MKRKFFFSIAFKAYIFFVAVLLVTLLGNSYYIHKQSKHTVDSMVSEQFNQAMNMAENHFDLLKQMNKTLVNNLAEDHELINYISLNAKEKLKVFIADKRYDIQCDQIILLDNEAKVITQSGSIPFEGNSLQNLEIVEQTLTQNKQFSKIIRQFDIFVLYTSSPVVINNKRQGMLLMGFSMNHKMMQNIKKETVMEFSIIGDRIVAATSFNVDKNLFTALPMPYTDYLWLLKHPNKYYESSIGGENYYLTAHPLKNLDTASAASILMAYPTVQVQEHEYSLIKSIIISTSAAIIFFMIIIFIFAKKMRNIFKIMILQTQKISQGDYEQRLKFETNDEFELLSQNFNSMTQSLQLQRQTIIDYSKSLESKVLKRTQELNEQKHSLEQILDLHPSMILTIQGDTIIYANQQFLDFFKIDSIDSIQTKEQFGRCFKANLSDLNKEDTINLFIESLFKKNNQAVSVYTDNGERKVFEVDFIIIDTVNDKKIAVFNDITRLNDENERLEKQAVRDVLTGQYNRVKFNEELEKAIYSVNRYNSVYSLVICDVDNFKRINDTYGHVIGDYALVKLSEIFSKRIRISDLFARWGGEEFVILLDSASIVEAESFANTLRQALAGYHFENFETLTCSFGVTQIKKGDTIESLINRADKGLYYAKKCGKNMVKIV